MPKTKRAEVPAKTLSKRLETTQSDSHQTSLREEILAGPEKLSTQDGDEVTVQEELSVSLESIRSTLEQKREWARAFTLRVQKEEDELARSVKLAKDKIINDRRVFMESMLPMLIDAIAPLELVQYKHPAYNVASSNQVHLPTTTSRFREQTACLVARSESLASVYNTFSKQEHITMSPAKEQIALEMDEDIVKRTVRAGRGVVNAEIEALLAEKPNSLHTIPMLSDEDIKLGKHLLALGEDKNNTSDVTGMSWGPFVHDLKKVVGNMEELAMRE